MINNSIISNNEDSFFVSIFRKIFRFFIGILILILSLSFFFYIPINYFRVLYVFLFENMPCLDRFRHFFLLIFGAYFLILSLYVVLLYFVFFFESLSVFIIHGISQDTIFRVFETAINEKITFRNVISFNLF